MSKVIELTDEQYCIVEYAAQARGQPLEALVEAWVEQVRDPDRFPLRYYDTDDWFRHLGMSEEVIEEIKREVREEVVTDADTQ